MTDYTELKRLADELIAANDLFNESPQDNEVGDAWSLANDRFTEAASPEFILALIAENERLHESDQEATELCDTLSVLLGEIAVEVRGPEEPKSRHGFHDLPSRVKTVVSERDQLRAEIAGLKTGYEAYERVNAELKAEVGALRRDKSEPCDGCFMADAEVLRKDAGRYRWLRRAGNTKAIALVAEHCLDALDEAIDAALGQGEQS